MLSGVEWGEYRIGDLFEVLSYKKRFDANKVTLHSSGHPYIVRTSANNGCKGYLQEDETYLNEGNTLSFGQDTATVFYQKIPYFTGDKIKILKCKDGRFKKEIAPFFISTIDRAFSSFSWGSSSFSEKAIKAQLISLPTRDGRIDFEFMERFVAELKAQRVVELKAQRVAELKAYLAVTGLSDYTLTPEEQQAIQHFQEGNLQWRKRTFRSIFNHIKQGRRLKKDDQQKGSLPFVMSGVSNTGVVSHISNPIVIFPSNSITIDIFGNSFYRNYSFGAGDDTGVYWSTERKYSKSQMLFFTTAMGRSLFGQYSYGNKLRSSQSLNFKMSLIEKGGEIDYNYMETFIRAIEKLVIRDVVLYADRELAATEQVINQ